MTQTIGILGFFLALLALYLASEVMRRANHRQEILEAEVFKANARLQKLESSVFHVEKLAAEIRHQRRRQAETITALANRADAQRDATLDLPQRGGERFTPSSQNKAKTRNTG